MQPLSTYQTNYAQGILQICTNTLSYHYLKKRRKRSITDFKHQVNMTVASAGIFLFSLYYGDFLFLFLMILSLSEK